MNNYLRGTAVMLIAVFAFAQPQASSGETVEIKIVKSTFFPAVIKIKKGDTVRWTNTEELLHAVASGKAPMHDGRINEEYVLPRFETKIGQAGFIDYFCVLHHATMRGVIIVEDVPGTEAPAR